MAQRGMGNRSAMRAGEEDLIARRAMIGSGTTELNWVGNGDHIVRRRMLLTRIDSGQGVAKIPIDQEWSARAVCSRRLGRGGSIVARLEPGPCVC